MDAVLKVANYEEKQIIDKTHPPVLLGVKFAADQGVLKRGLLIAVIAGSDEHVPYDPTADDGTEVPKGVLTSAVDTDGAVQVGTSLVHGTVVSENLHVNTNALSAADLAALKAITVYPL